MTTSGAPLATAYTSDDLPPIALISAPAAKNMVALLHLVRRTLVLAALVACASPLADHVGTRAVPVPVEPRVAVAPPPAAPEITADSARAWLDNALGWVFALPAPVPDVSMLVQAPILMGEPSDFGWRSDPFRHTPKFHSGADFRAKPGTPILAAGAGVVTRYAHMRRIVAHKDDQVTAGTTIGEVGQSGHATGPHLHFEVLLDGRFVDPVMAMTVGEIERSSPVRGRLASFALVEQLQASPKEPPAKTAATPRPERQGRAKRTQALW